MYYRIVAVYTWSMTSESALCHNNYDSSIEVCVASSLAQNLSTATQYIALYCTIDVASTI